MGEDNSSRNEHYDSSEAGGQPQSPPPARPPQPPHPAPPAAPVPGAAQPQPRRKGSRFVRTVVGSVLLLSILLNVYLLIMIASQLAGPFQETVIREGQKDQTIAVYELSGIIDGEAASRFLTFYHEIASGSDVRAVVLRVESPGGGLTASDQIYQVVRRIRDDGKTVVVSMGAVAASGGYYVSAPADEIIAEPTSITGSIGVLMQWFVLKGTLEKLGVEPVVMKSDDAQAWKDEISIYDEPAEHHREHLQKILNSMQDRFEQVVRQGRAGRLQTTTTRRTITAGSGDEAEEVTFTETEPLNGKIYLADEALEFGLVDRIGYMEQALDRAEELAGLPDAHVVQYRARPPLLAQLMGRSSEPNTLISPDTIEKLRSPRLMLLWKVE
ncbi:MAG: S49 family peptidase [Phycisphaerae bacterium]